MARRLPRSRILLAALVLALVAAAPARGEPPPPISATLELRRHLDHLLATVRTPQFRSLAPAAQRQEIRRLTGPVFNWTDISRHTLGAEWGERTAAERRAFTRVFASLAERAYLGPVERLARRATNIDPIRYEGEATAGADTLVRTTLLYPRPLPVDFVMRRPRATWEVWDVRIDGVSAAENYAAQLRRMRPASFEALLAQLASRAGEGGDTALSSGGR